MAGLKLIHSPTQALTLTHPPTYRPTHSPAHSLTHLPSNQTHSLTHPLVKPPHTHTPIHTHPFTNPPTYSFDNHYILVAFVVNLAGTQAGHGEVEIVVAYDCDCEFMCIYHDYGKKEFKCYCPANFALAEDGLSCIGEWIQFEFNPFPVSITVLPTLLWLKMASVV